MQSNACYQIPMENNTRRKLLNTPANPNQIQIKASPIDPISTPWGIHSSHTLEVE